MTHRFDSSVLKAVDVTECDPGFYLHLTNFAGPARLILKLDSENKEHYFWVNLSSDKLFNTTFSVMPNVGNLVLIPLSGTPVKIEFPDTPKLTNNSESIGVISVCKEGAYLTTHRSKGTDEFDVKYVSLQSFKICDRLPSNLCGVFTTWRLTTSEANPSERTVLVSKGDWTE